MADWLKSQFGQLHDAPLHTQLRRFRWIIFPAVLLLAALHQFALYLISGAFPTSWGWWVQLLVDALTGSIAVWLGITWISDAAANQFETEENRRQAYNKLDHNYRQILALHNLRECVAAADNHHSIIEIAARAPFELPGTEIE